MSYTFVGDLSIKQRMSYMFVGDLCIKQRLSYMFVGEMKAFLSMMQIFSRCGESLS